MKPFRDFAPGQCAGRKVQGRKTLEKSVNIAYHLLAKNSLMSTESHALRQTVTQSLYCLRRCPSRFLAVLLSMKSCCIGQLF